MIYRIIKPLNLRDTASKTFYSNISYIITWKKFVKPKDVRQIFRTGLGYTAIGVLSSKWEMTKGFILGDMRNSNGNGVCR